MADASAAMLEALFGSGINAADDSGLNLFRKTVAGNDYWRAAAAPVLGAKFDTSLWSPGQTLATTAGQAFLGGILNALGQRDEARQLESVASVLPKLYSDPNSVTVPEGVDPEAFGQLKLSALATRQKSETAANSALFKELFGTKIAGKTSEEQEIGKARGREKAYGLSGENDPESPKYKVTKDTRDLEKMFYDRITALPQAKQLADIESNFKALKELAKQDTKAADIGLISTVARIRDPMSTVREGEFAINSDTQAYLDQMIGNWRGVISGESKLTPTDKSKIIASVIPKYNELGQSYLSVRNPLLDALEAQGGNRANIPTMDFKPEPMPNIFDKQSLIAEANALKMQGLSPAQVAAELRAKYSEGAPRG